MATALGLKHDGPVRDRISFLPAEIKIQILAEIKVAEVVGLQLLNKNWQALILSEESLLARSICERENQRLRLDVKKCDIRGVEFLAALIRYDELFNIYNDTRPIMKTAKRRAFGDAYLTAAIDHSAPLLEELGKATAAATAADFLFRQQRYAVAGQWEASFACNILGGQDGWSALGQRPEDVRAMCSRVIATRPFGRGASLNIRKRRMKTIEQSSQDIAVGWAPAFLGPSSGLWFASSGHLLALPRLHLDWLFVYVEPEARIVLSASCRPLELAVLRETIEIELLL